MATYEQLISNTKKYQKSFSHSTPHGDEALLSAISKIYNSLNSQEQKRYCVEFLAREVNVRDLGRVTCDISLLGAGIVAGADFCLTGSTSVLRCAGMSLLGCVSGVLVTEVANSFFRKIPTFEESFYKMSAYYRIMEKLNMKFNGAAAKIREAFLGLEKWLDKSLPSPQPLTMKK